MHMFTVCLASIHVFAVCHCTAARTKVQEHYAESDHLMLAQGSRQQRRSQRRRCCTCAARRSPCRPCCCCLCSTAHSAARATPGARSAEPLTNKPLYTLTYTSRPDARSCCRHARAALLACGCACRAKLLKRCQRIEPARDCLQDSAPGGRSAECSQLVARSAAHPGPGRGHCARPSRLGSAGTILGPRV